MKKLLRIILAMAVIGFFTACSGTDDFELENLDAFKHHEEKELTLGFNALFIGDYQFPDFDPALCPDLVQVKNTGVGTGTHFKTLKSYFEFCVQPVAPEDGGGGTYPEGHMIAYFEDENGDKLYIKIDGGRVYGGRVPGMPSYALSYFKDYFEFDGGTGKFEGASGSGYTNDYNFIDKKLGIQRTSHHWQGTLTLIKKK